MATFNKYQNLVEDLGNGVHNLSTDTLKLALFTATHTPAAGDEGFAALTNEVAAGNGYTAGGETLANVSWSESAGTGTLDADDPSWTASGGSIAYQYAILYNDTAAGKDLICYWDEGSTVTIADGETRTLNFDASGILTLA